MALTYLERSAITSQHREEFYRIMAKLAADGLPSYEVLNHLGREFKRIKHPLSPLIIHVMLGLRGGGGASSGNGSQGRRSTVGSMLMGLVPDSEAMLIQSGESNGLIAAGYENAADLIAAQREIGASIKSALAKPFGYLVALVALLLFFGLKLLPSFERTSPRASWPADARVLGSIADNVYWITGSLVGAVILVAVALAWIVPRWDGELRNAFDRKVFPFTVISSVYGASLLTSLAGYINAGTPFVNAVQHIRTIANPYMQMQCTLLMNAMKKGKTPEEGLIQLSLLPVRYHWVISVYGMSSHAGQAYKEIAREMLRLVKNRLYFIFDSVLKNLLMAIVGGMLFWIYLSMFSISTAGHGAL
jgi:type II secretory pathway component PulF